MSPLLPSRDVLNAVFGAGSSKNPSSSTTFNRSDIFQTWSVTEDAKVKADQLTEDAKVKADQLTKEAKVKAEQLTSAVKSGSSGKIELYSPMYFASATFGGLMACGLTHWAVTPLDLVKCRRQVDSKLYKGNLEAWGKISRAEGLRGVYTGGGPTFWGYSAQGSFKYGLYEFFKYYYASLAGEENAHKYVTGLYLTASASAEFFADIALCPLEAVKVRMQTSMPPFATGTVDGLSKIVKAEGYGGLYKGLYPLWGRQIPYTMMKFASFETIVAMMYERLPGKKSDYSKAAQTSVSFAAGYLAGILCAIVSHPADVMVSKLNAGRLPGEAFGAAMSRIYKDIGFGGLWNGLPVRIVMIGTLTGAQWSIYDAFKVYMGFPTTGGAAPAK